ncbi:hypothetical protein MES4922_400011 [Mesorhizobium ventifaucium]|uniref:Uncharacterized protein n=1 Tax=Mesorhizobium ventifaucium TaxID=666020 RepID=A0ABM9EAM4_9HYPH|nr:hypothetical protein MES4922_400011 [Mesorhizobium ventifaucium]
MQVDPMIVMVSPMFKGMHYGWIR